MFKPQVIYYEKEIENYQLGRSTQNPYRKS